MSKTRRIVEHPGLYQAILEQPDDDTPRLIYSDWLEEHGDPARAEFIRAQCQLARTAEAQPGRQELVARQKALLEKNRERWLPPYPSGRGNAPSSAEASWPG
jgi:uncharacterized protein (TIGR02996 family)